MTSWLISLALLLSVFQASTFKADPPHQCEDCPTWNKPRAPFRVYGNTYYVGTDGLSALLVTGDAGHVLLDAGLPQSAPLIDANIRALGFKTEDVKLILISHGHFDHAGGANALQRHTGATVAASASTAEAMRRGENTPDDPQYGFGKKFNGFPEVKNVKVVGDQEVLTVGKTAITVHLIPGHAPGSTAYTWQSCSPARPQAATAESRRSSTEAGRAEADGDGKCLNMVYADSLTSPSAPGFKYGSRLDSFQKSIEKVAALPCDIVLSPHPQFTQVDQKLKRRAEMKGSGPDPFIDPGGCKAYAAGGMKQLEARRAQEAKP
ncbi:MAG TPA: metallo-beta-lactamase [Vicinamibacterales bacterium]|nr:metallo-beta-lactamase [Vicinamibacterales bacterium]